MTRRCFAAAVAALALLVLSGSAAAGMLARRPADRSPASMVYSVPEQCVVLAVARTEFVKARALLAGLGCRVHPIEQKSKLAKGLVISVVGGERSYPFGHVVKLIVSSGPA